MSDAELFSSDKLKKKRGGGGVPTKFIKFTIYRKRPWTPPKIIYIRACNMRFNKNLS